MQPSNPLGRLTPRPSTRQSHNLVVLWAALLAVSLGAAPARADFVNTTFSDVNPGQVVSITYKNSQGKTVTESGWAGVYNFTNSSGALTGNFQGFCIDIAQDIFFNQTVQFQTAALANAPTPGTQMGTLKANLIAELWYNNFDKVMNDVKPNPANSDAAAFQLAVWMIINGGITDNKGKFNLNDPKGATTLSNGTLSVSSDSTTIATTYAWLKALDLTGNGNRADLMALTNPTYQDYVVQGSVVSTPAPGGVLLGAVGIVGLLIPLALRRRRAATSSHPA